MSEHIPVGSRTSCTNCNEAIVYLGEAIGWIHDHDTDYGFDPVPCDGEVPVAEPLATWTPAPPVTVPEPEGGDEE